MVGLYNMDHVHKHIAQSLIAREEAGRPGSWVGTNARHQTA